MLSLNILGQENIDKSRIDTTETLIFVDTMPTMQNGECISKGFSTLFSDEFKYPDTIECKIISIIYFEFVIRFDGTISDKNVRFNSNIEECAKDYNLLKKAGLVLLDKFPKCIPGSHEGKLVNVRFRSPVHLMYQ